jgi:hypothetical protein
MSSLIRSVALVTDDNIDGEISAADLSHVAAALQKQVTRDFGPIWGVIGTVSPFQRLDDVPLGYWPILIGQENQHGGGVHLDQDNQPFALVDLTDDWTMTASHECLEMLADPFGNRLVSGDSPNPKRPGRVDFLVEICDPCEKPDFGYTVNGIRVSDFYTPRYFDPAQPSMPHPARYDFMGHITEPRQVLPQGYLSWREGDGEWFQELYFGKKPQFRPIGKFDKSAGSLRTWIDSTSAQLRLAALREIPSDSKAVLTGVGSGGRQRNNLADTASTARAARLREAIASVRRQK